MSDFDYGYRKGVFWTLLTLKNIFREQKILDGNMRIPIKLYFDACLNNIDAFMRKGDNTTFVFKEHDKKGIPTKIEASDLSWYEYRNEIYNKNNK